MRTKKYSVYNEKIADYVYQLLNFEKDKQLRFALEQAKKQGTPFLQMTPSDARHLEILARSLNPNSAVEIGTLCGYSTICLARGLREGGKIYTLERSAHHAQIARATFSSLELSHKIELVFGEALSSLETLSAKAPFDLVFIDADKENYPHYFDWAIKNLRSGGLLIADNVFAFDHIVDSPMPEGKLGEIVQALLTFNEKCATHSELISTFLPTGEGLMVAFKK